MGGATVPFAERYARMPRCAFEDVHVRDDCVISLVLVPVTLTANLSCFNASCFRTWYECPPPRRGRERARQELPRPLLLAIPSQSSQTLFQLRVLTPKALKGKLKRTRPRGNTEAPASARGAKHCTVWMGVPVHFLRNRATFSPRSASILNLCMALHALPWARCAQLVGPGAQHGAGGGVGNSPSVLRRRPSADGKRLYV